MHVPARRDRRVCRRGRTHARPGADDRGEPELSGDSGCGPGWRSSQPTAHIRRGPGFGPRTGIQLRCRQGWMASSESHCQMVVPEMLAARPRWSTSARMSGTWSRDRGSPSWLGSSQAIALTATTSSGGKNWAPTRAIALLEPGQACLEEPLPPLAYHLATGVEALSNLVVAQALGGQQDEGGSEDVAIRQRIFPGPGFQEFLRAQSDLEVSPFG